MSQRFADSPNDERRQRSPRARRGFPRREFLRLLDDLQLKLRRLEERIEEKETRSAPAEGRFRALVESLPLPLAHLSALRGDPGEGSDPGEIVDFVCRYVNPAGLEACGRSEAESPVGRRLLAELVVDDADGRGLFEACRDVVESGRPRVVEGQRCRCRQPGSAGDERGGRFDLHLGKVGDAVAVAWHPTARGSHGGPGEAEGEAVGEPSGDERTLILTLAHELKTPLNALVGFSDLLKSEIVGTLNEAQKVQIERIRHSCRHLSSIVETVVSAWAGPSSEERVRSERVNLAGVVREVGDLMQLEVERRDLALEIRGPGAPVEARTDPGKVRQVLINLVSNAVKHARAKVRIALEEDDDGSVRFEVSDDGPGIPEEHREAIFEPYVRLSDADGPSGKAGGRAGLGLAVCTRLAELLGGDVTVDSEVGEGSTFTLRIPRG